MKKTTANMYTIVAMPSAQLSFPCVFNSQHLFLDEPSSFWASRRLCEWVNLRIRVPHVLRGVCDSFCNILAVLIADERIRHVDAC